MGWRSGITREPNLVHPYVVDKIICVFNERNTDLRWSEKRGDPQQDHPHEKKKFETRVKQIIVTSV